MFWLLRSVSAAFVILVVAWALGRFGVPLPSYFWALVLIAMVVAFIWSESDKGSSRKDARLAFLVGAVLLGLLAWALDGLWDSAFMAFFGGLAWINALWMFGVACALPFWSNPDRPRAEAPAQEPSDPDSELNGSGI